MKKYINKLILSLAVLTLVTSCDEDDDNNVDTVPYSTVTVNLSVDENNVTVSENDLVDSQTYTITASIAQPQVLDYLIKIEQVAGDATEGVDFTFDHDIILSRGTTSATGTVTILKSGDIENDESFTLVAKSFNEYFNVSDFSFSATIVDDYVNDVLSMDMDWSGEYSYTPAGLPAEVTIEFCEMDLDLLVYDSNGNDTGIYDAATGACPESIDFSGLPDGTYTLVINVYANPFSGLGTAAPVPITFTYSQEFILEETVFTNNGITADTPDGTNVIAAELEVVDGYIYTVTPQ